MPDAPASAKSDRHGSAPRNADMLEEILSVGPAVVYVADPANDFATIYASPNVEAYTGYRPADFIDNPGFWAQNLHPDDAPRIFEGLSHLFENDHHVHEYRFRCRDGHFTWVRDELKLLRSREGAPERLIGYWTDINDRKATEEALRRSQASLANAQRIAHLGNWEWDPDTGTLHWSDEVFRILGVEPRQFEPSYEAFLDLVHPDDREFVRASVDQALENGADYEIDFRIARSDGSIRIVNEKGEVLRDGAGRPTWMIGTIHDVTEQRRASEALAESAARLRLIADAMPALIYYADDQLRYRFVNKLAESWMARHSSELLGRSMETAFGADVVAELRPYWDRALAGETVSFEKSLTSPDGTARDVQVTYIPHETDRGEVAGFFGLVIDQTESKAMEESLRQAMKMEALGSLTGGVAHEFNNLLQAISSSLYLLKRKVDVTDDLAEIFEIAEHAAQRGADLTYRLLSYVGKRPANPEVTNPGDAIDGAIRLLRPVLPETIDIERDIGSDLWPILVDQAQFESAIFNIAINSRDAIPSIGKIAFTVRNAHLDEDWPGFESMEVAPGDYVYISVSDTGTGMPPEVAEHAFDPFFTTKGVGKGTGLGLSMVYGFVCRQSGGHVGIDSSVGAGTTLNIYLPRAPGQVRAPEVSLGYGGFEEVAAATVLVAEDDEQVRASIKLQLEGMGLRVVAVQNGAEAYDLFERVRYFDLVLTDAVMPGGPNGFELARAVRRLSKAANVIVMTGYTNSEAPVEAAVANGVRVLQKPFSAETLTVAVRDALSLDG